MQSVTWKHAHTHTQIYTYNHTDKQAKCSVIRDQPPLVIWASYKRNETQINEWDRAQYLRTQHTWINDRSIFSNQLIVGGHRREFKSITDSLNQSKSLSFNMEAQKRNARIYPSGNQCIIFQPIHIITPAIQSVMTMNTSIHWTVQFSLEFEHSGQGYELLHLFWSFCLLLFTSVQQAVSARQTISPWRIWPLVGWLRRSTFSLVGLNAGLMSMFDLDFDQSETFINPLSWFRSNSNVFDFVLYLCIDLLNGNSVCVKLISHMAPCEGRYKSWKHTHVACHRSGAEERTWSASVCCPYLFQSQGSFE